MIPYLFFLELLKLLVSVFDSDSELSLVNQITEPQLPVTIFILQKILEITKGASEGL